MLAALPAEATIVIGFDVEKLRNSPIARRGWELFSKNEKVMPFLEPLCGSEADVRYALFGIDGKTMALWGWIDGIPRGSRLKCAKAREQLKANPHKEVDQGDYMLTTSQKYVTEVVWFGDHTSFVVARPSSESPLGEGMLRAMVEKHRGITPDTTVGSALDHVDFNSGITFAIDGRAMPNAPAKGVAMSVELDDALRAQIFVQFADEDHAADLRARYRKLIEMAMQKQLIDSGDTRVSGTGMAASVTVTSAQVEWWLETAKKYAASH